MYTMAPLLNQSEILTYKSSLLYLPVKHSINCLANPASKSSISKGKFSELIFTLVLKIRCLIIFTKLFESIVTSELCCDVAIKWECPTRAAPAAVGAVLRDSNQWRLLKVEIAWRNSFLRRTYGLQNLFICILLGLYRAIFYYLSQGTRLVHAPDFRLYCNCDCLSFPRVMALRIFHFIN